MASTFSTNSKLELVTTGEKAGLWGTITNTNLQILEQLSTGYLSSAQLASGDLTLTLDQGATSNGKNIYIKLTGTLGANRSITIPDSSERVIIFEDATTRGSSALYTITVKTVSGSGVVLPIGSPAGGIYTGNGVGGGDFDPSSAGVGSHIIIYTYTDSNTCINSDTIIVYVQSCVGINEIITDFGIIIYPNPSTGQFTIKNPSGLNKKLQIKLLDVTSKLILEKNIPIGEQETSIDITKYNKGVYYLQLSIDGEQFIKQIIKN